MRTISLIISFFICLASCSKEQKKQAPLVLVTVPPYAYIVERIAEDKVLARTLVPPGANPHVFEPTFTHVEHLNRTALWIRLNEPIEHKIYTVLKEQDPELKTLDLSANISLIETEEGHAHAHHESVDRHFWLSPKLLKRETTQIGQALIALLPEFSSLFERNLETLLREIDELDNEITLRLAPLRGEAILVSHPAFGYFCRDYGLIQLSVEEEGKDPLPQHITELMQEAEKYHVRAVLLQAQYNNRGAELIAEKLHLTTTLFDPYAKDVLSNIHKLAAVIYAD